MRKNIALVVVGLLAGLVTSAGVASAHAAYKSSDPADGATVSSPPSRVTAEFTEPLADGSYLQVTDPCGARVDAGDVSIVGYEMSVSMSGSRSGRYTVFYKAFSRLDPHVVEGTFEFTATSGSSCSPPEDDPEPSGDSSGSSGSGGSNEPERSGGSDAGSSSRSTQVDLAQGGAGGDDRRTRRASGERSDRSQRTSGVPGRPPSSARVPNITAPEEDGKARDDSVYDGIPMGSFAVSLLFAGLIGAAGGKIYAGIMGPRA